jgi:hypothetical protein
MAASQTSIVCPSKEHAPATYRKSLIEIIAQHPGSGFRFLILESFQFLFVTPCNVLFPK